MPPAGPTELRDGRRRHWFWAHNAIWDVPDLSAHAILVYLYLCRCADAGGTCWPSRSTIARACRISKDSVDRAIKQLCERGLLIKESRQGPDGAYASNLYTILDPPAPNEAPEPPPSRTQRPPLAAHSGHPLAALSGYPRPQGAATLAAGNGYPSRNERPEGQPIEGQPKEQHHPVSVPRAARRDDDVTLALSVLTAARTQVAASAESATSDAAAAHLAAAYRRTTGGTLTEGEARQIVERYGLAYALEKLELVAWQQSQGGFERGPKAYYLAALKGDWRVEPHVPARIQKRQEAERRQEEEARKREEERQRIEAEKRLAAALDALIDTLPVEERVRLEAEAEARVRQRTSDKVRSMIPVHRLLVQVEMRALARKRYGNRLQDPGLEAGS
ncbi:MAG TPA: helix-turn-helix domain-containing protein [Calditerricola sp.]